MTFTTPERDNLILKNEDLQLEIRNMKDQWLFGIHHHWHDFNFHYNDLFDFHLAGEEDLIEANGKPIPLIPLDACNFSPRCFYADRHDKHWDILYVARAVFFKKIPEFFQIIRKLYDAGLGYRVLLIAPQPEKYTNRKTEYYNMVSDYETMFSQEERNLFNLMAPQYNYPFPYDIETLAHFYRASKIFVHTADDERRCRVAAYAWATGLPVVGTANVGSILPKALRKAPLFFQASGYDDFVIQIKKSLKTVANTKSYKPSSKGNIVRSAYMEKELIRKLERILGQKREFISYAIQDLDIRLGRHHGLSFGRNKINMDLTDFLRFLRDQHETLKLNMLKDPEFHIAQNIPLAPRRFNKENSFIAELLRRVK